MSIDSSFATEEDFDRQPSLDAQAEKSPQTLEREIDARRANIGSIVDALENKISPGQLIDQALAYTKGNGGEFFNQLGSTIKANPLPTVLTTVGLAWLMLGQNRQASPASTGHPSTLDSLGEHASSMAESLSDTFGDAKARLQATAAKMKDKASHLSDKASDLGDHVGESLSGVSDRLHARGHDANETLHRQGQNLRSSFDYMLREQPLALAAMGIALGAALGAALPSTDKEDSLMGAASDRMTSKVKGMASETYDKATDLGKGFVADVTQGTGGAHQSSSDTPANGASAAG